MNNIGYVLLFLLSVFVSSCSQIALKKSANRKHESKIKEILNSNLDVMNKELKIEVQTMVEKSIENKIVELSIQIQEVKKILFGIAIIIGLGVISILLF